MKSNLRKSKLLFLLSFRYVLRHRNFWLRGFVCYAVGLGFLLLPSNRGFDQRFALRDSQKVNEKVVLVTVSQREWVNLNGRFHQWPGPMKDGGEGQDSFYWNPKIWNKILHKITEGHPEKIGVTFNFAKLLYDEGAIGYETSIFQDSRIVWNSKQLTQAHALPMRPIYKIAQFAVVPDSDGIVRSWTRTKARSMIQELTQKNGVLPSIAGIINTQQTINFQAPQEGFINISVLDVLKGVYGPGLFTDKIVIIGGEDAVRENFPTPIGLLNRVTLLANIVDNVMGQKMIRRGPKWTYALGLLALLLISSWIMSLYPQSVALVFFLGIGIVVAALSIWMFDTYYFWIPIGSPLLQLATTYMIFLSYQLTVADYQNWMLEKERKSSTDVEKLKNNFLSLFSHDLKTPIAKIQAICDRVTAQNPDHEFASELASLRKESAELHKYIQTILQITRVESKKFKLNRAPSDINEIVENVAAQIAPLIEVKQQNLEVVLDPLFLVEIDSILMQEVILNLVENAIKYTSVGGKIRLTTKEVDDKIVFMVEDSGLGISGADQEKIFDKFFRGPNVDHVGSGLGLYLVKYFIELHQGRVLLESQVGKGTYIGFWVPAYDDPNEQTYSEPSNGTIFERPISV